MSGDATRSERRQLDPFVVAIGDAAPRDQRDLMERPFFSLAKAKRTAPILYEAGGQRVEVHAMPEHGMATIWDADVLIWAASQIVDAANHGLRTSRFLRFTPYQMLLAIDRATGARECSTCIMVRKHELRAWSMRFPAEVDRVREWERLVSLVSRRTAVAGTPASLLPAPTVPGDRDNHGRATIDRAIEWSRTGRGGRNYDLFVDLERREADAHGLLCDSDYGLCE